MILTTHDMTMFSIPLDETAHLAAWNRNVRFFDELGADHPAMLSVSDREKELRRRMPGFLAEEAVQRIDPHLFERVDNPEYDLLFGGKVKIEVKSTHSNYTPNSSWTVAVLAKQVGRRYDFIVWCNIKQDWSEGQVFTYNSKAEFYEAAELKLKGFDTGYFKLNRDKHVAPVVKMRDMKYFLDDLSTHDLFRA